MSKNKPVIWSTDVKSISFLKELGFQVKKKKSEARGSRYLLFNLIFVPTCTSLFLVAFMIFQFLGEWFDFSPVISLSGPGWLSSYEAVLLFVLIIAIAQVIALNLTFYLMDLLKKMESDK